MPTADSRPRVRRRRRQRLSGHCRFRHERHRQQRQGLPIPARTLSVPVVPPGNYRIGRAARRLWLPLHGATSDLQDLPRRPSPSQTPAPGARPFHQPRPGDPHRPAPRPGSRRLLAAEDRGQGWPGWATSSPTSCRWRIRQPERPRRDGHRPPPRGLPLPQGVLPHRRRESRRPADLRRRPDPDLRPRRPSPPEPAARSATWRRSAPAPSPGRRSIPPAPSATAASSPTRPAPPSP